MQDGNTVVKCSPKCINYRIFKTNFVLKNHLLSLPRDLRIVFAKIRTCNYRLPVETGRWENIERHLRISTLCGCNGNGDEFHYVMECTQFVMIQWWNDIVNDIVKCFNIIKFNELMDSNDVEILKPLSKLSKLSTSVLPKFSTHLLLFLYLYIFFLPLPVIYVYMYIWFCTSCTSVSEWMKNWNEYCLIVRIEKF